METKSKIQFVKDLANKKIKVIRDFNAPVDKVWKAWTDPAILDLWWAPKPWKAQTRSMDFREGGTWLYAMIGPDGIPTWCRVDYLQIETGVRFSGKDAFCDEKGIPGNEFPVSKWDCKFKATDTGSRVEIEVSYATVADLEKIAEMGFEEGFTMALTNLDEWLMG